MEPLSARGRAFRIVATLVVGALTLAGTLVGQDDHFPFAPFRMFSTRDDPNQPVKVLRLDGIDNTGKRIELNERNAGVRRAEVEGQLDDFKADPGRLRSVRTAYASRNPSAAELVGVEIVEVNHQLRHGRPTGEVTDVVLVVWRP